MPEKQYLAISNPEDEHLGHIPFVADHMDGRLRVIDPVPGTIAGRGLSYVINNDASYCEYDGEVLDNVISVWDRRPTVPSRDMFEPVAQGFRKYAYSAVQRLAQQIHVQFPGA